MDNKWRPHLFVGESINVAALEHQASLRHYHRLRFFGLVIGPWQIGLFYWQKEEPTHEP